MRREQLAAAVGRACLEPAYRRRAAAMAANIASDRGAEAACRWIEAAAISGGSAVSDPPA